MREAFFLERIEDAMNQAESFLYYYACGFGSGEIAMMYQTPQDLVAYVLDKALKTPHLKRLYEAQKARIELCNKTGT